MGDRKKNGRFPRAIVIEVLVRQRMDPCTEPAQRNGVFLAAKQPILRQNLQQRSHSDAEGRSSAAGVRTYTIARIDALGWNYQPS